MTQKECADPLYGSAKWIALFCCLISYDARDNDFDALLLRHYHETLDVVSENPHYSIYV